MNDLVQDIWHDLRAKRLWPVALVLALGIVAIPVMLMQSSEPPPAPPVVTEAEPEPDGVEVQLAEIAGGGAGSALDTLGRKNPFKPPAGVMRSGDTATATATSATAGPSPSAAASDSSGGSDAPAPGTPASDTPAGDSPGGGGSPGDSDDGGSTDDAAPPTERPPTTTAYEYVVDLTFWNGDRRRSRRGLRKLDMLPNQSHPVLIYMGTTDRGGNAVFLVDATLDGNGEGACRPSRANCVYVHLGPGSQHSFADEEGAYYRLRVDQIRRVRTDRGKGRRTGSKGARGARARSGHEADEPAAGRRPFALPALIDIELDTTQRAAPPAPDHERGGDR